MFSDSAIFYSNTAFLNLTSNVWTDGPTLSVPRYYHTCTLVTLSNGWEKEIVVVGGQNPDMLLQSSDNCTYLRSVEIINLHTNQVRAGEDSRIWNYSRHRTCSTYYLDRTGFSLLLKIPCRVNLWGLFLHSRRYMVQGWPRPSWWKWLLLLRKQETNLSVRNYPSLSVENIP